MEVISTTRDSLIETYGEENIVAKVLGISTSEVLNALTAKRAISNPLRIDNNPSLMMKWTSRHHIYLHDFVYSIFRGDIFDLAGAVFGLNCKVGKEFKAVLILVNKLMSGEREMNTLIVHKRKKVKETTANVITFTPRAIMRSDLAYWLHLFTKQELIKDKIQPVIAARINGKELTDVSVSNLAYAYTFSVKGNIAHVELYMPYNRSGHRFKTNMLKLKIPPTLIKSKTLILIKSYKDAVVLSKIFKMHKVKIAVIALPTETYILSKVEYTALLKHYPTIYMMSDYDGAGIASMMYHNVLYNIEPLVLKHTEDIELDDFLMKEMTNRIASHGGFITNEDIYDFIAIANELALEAPEKDVYSIIKKSKDNIPKIINYVKSRI